MEFRLVIVLIIGIPISGNKVTSYFTLKKVALGILTFSMEENDYIILLTFVSRSRF